MRMCETEVREVKGEVRLGATGDFSNGNGKVVEVDEAGRRVVIEAVVKGGRNIWWHVKLMGLVRGEEYVLEVKGVDAVAGDGEPVVSFDGESWERLGETRSPFRVRAKGETAWVSRNIPYTYERAMAVAEELKGKAEVMELCVSERGRAVPVLRVGGKAEGGKRLMWVMARQHAFESHSSRVAEGLARWAVSEGEEARRFRETFVLYVVLMMDVDSVVAGAGGKDLKPDYNHVWGKAGEKWRAVEAAERLIKEEAGRNLPAVLVDLHSPYFPEGSHWYGPTARYAEAWGWFEKFYGDYVKGLEGAVNVGAVDMKPRQALKVVEEGTGEAFRMWAAGVVGQAGFAVTLETTHGRDARGRFVEVEGLRRYGEQLGRSAGRVFGGRI